VHHRCSDLSRRWKKLSTKGWTKENGSVVFMIGPGLQLIFSGGDRSMEGGPFCFLHLKRVGFGRRCLRVLENYVNRSSSVDVLVDVLGEAGWHLLAVVMLFTLKILGTLNCAAEFPAPVNKSPQPTGVTARSQSWDSQWQSIR